MAFSWKIVKKRALKDMKRRLNHFEKMGNQIAIKKCKQRIENHALP